MARDGHPICAQLPDESPNFRARGTQLGGDFRSAYYDGGVVRQQLDDALQACVGGFQSGRVFGSSGWGQGSDGMIMRDSRRSAKLSGRTETGTMRRLISAAAAEGVSAPTEMN